MTPQKAKSLNPLVLAFVGDAVMTLYVREKLAKSSDAKAGKLHLMTSKTICSKAQSALLDKVFESLNDDEKEIFRRCRNTKYHTTAKNGTIEDYKKASGLEAVLGYLYLTGNIAECIRILEYAYEVDR